MDGVPATTWDPNSIQLSNPIIRNEVNLQLGDVTDEDFTNPELAFERVREQLGNHDIVLPPVSSVADEFLEEDGEIILPLASDDDRELYYLYFAFTKIEAYEVFAEIFSAEELEDILIDDMDQEFT